jgi:hypothetical protein
MHDWWTGHRGDDFPDRSALDPFALKATLPNLLISDVECAPFRIRYRLVGTKIAEATGLNFTGQYLDELVPGDPDEPWMGDYRQSFDTRLPVLGTSTVQLISGASYFYEFGIFPMRNGGSEIVQFVGIEDYFDFSLVDLASPRSAGNPKRLTLRNPRASIWAASQRRGTSAQSSPLLLSPRAEHDR